MLAKPIWRASSVEMRKSAFSAVRSMGSQPCCDCSGLLGVDAVDKGLDGCGER